MTRSIKGILENIVFEEVSVGIYKISNVEYRCLTDTGGGAFDLKIGFLVYVPTMDLATGLPIPGEVARFIVRDLQVETSTEVSLWIEYDGYKNEPDPPASGLAGVICEPTQYGVGNPLSENIYTELTVGMATAILAEDIRKLLTGSSSTGGNNSNAEPNLGKPSSDGQLLASTITGRRYWTNAPSGSGGGSSKMNFEGGNASSVYGGTTPIDGGRA